MAQGIVIAEVPVNANVKNFVAMPAYSPPPSADIVIPDAVKPYITVTEQGGPGAFRQTLLTLTDLPQTVTDGTEYQGTEILNFPKCRTYVIAVLGSLAQKTTSALVSTINSGVTGALGLGTAAASNVSLTSTMVDLAPSTAFSSSTIINVAGTAVNPILAAAAFFDGTTTAKKMYLNSAYATTTDVDGNGTQTWSGTILITWINCGSK